MDSCWPGWMTAGLRTIMSTVPARRGAFARARPSMELGSPSRASVAGDARVMPAIQRAMENEARTNEVRTDDVILIADRVLERLADGGHLLLLTDYDGTL